MHRPPYNGGNMRERKEWDITVQGNARHAVDKRVLQFHWKIMVVVTSKNYPKTANVKQPRCFHVVWGDIFAQMFADLGLVFCNRYAERIRLDLFNAVKDVSTDYYPVKSAEAHFDITTYTERWIPDDTENMMTSLVRATCVM